MSDRLVDTIRREHYLLEIFNLTKDPEYIEVTRKIIEFVKDIYRNIEPSHFDGDIIVFFDFSNALNFLQKESVEFYDKAILNSSYSNIVLQVRNEKLPLIWTNIASTNIENLLNTPSDFIGYVFKDKKELFIVNKKVINIVNRFSCPSIFALQYHYLQEALIDYKNEKVKNVSCEHLKKCWDDVKWIYLKNKPENCMQVSLSEFLKSRIRGVNVDREFTLGASKPVDVRVQWREANRTVLIELKWFGQSLNPDGNIGTQYSNARANDGMKQIKEYIDLNNSDNPTTITKGYLIVVDARRRNISTTKVSSISRDDGLYYKNKELEIDEDKQYWKSFPEIEKPIRMFVEPVCEM